MVSLVFLVVGILTVAWFIFTRPKVNEHRQYAHGLPDLLLYSTLVDEEGAILLLKDGALMASWSFIGPDLASATHDEMDVLSRRLSSILRLGSGWMIHCDALRTKTPEYAKEGNFPDPITALIDAERRAQFTHEGSHFESRYILTLTYLPSSSKETKLNEFVFEGGTENKRGAATVALDTFKAKISSFQDVFSSQFRAKRLKAYTVTGDGGFQVVYNDLLRYVRYCVTGEDFPFVQPEIPTFLHDVIGCRDFMGGVAPEVGNKSIRCVAIEGFPRSSYPGVLSVLDTLPFEYRWNTRAILVDPHEAISAIDKEFKKWRGKMRGFLDMMLNRNGNINLHAADMAADAQGAMRQAEAGDVHFAIYSANIIIMGDDSESADANAANVVKVLQGAGFASRIETLNAIEAWRGSLPGDGYRNVRRNWVNTLNLADCMPITAIWPGEVFNPSPLMPRQSPPLLYATSVGATPFRFHLHVQDSGHTLLLGPPGSGKSTMLALIAAQWMRYQRGQVVVFDKGYSMWALNRAAGGKFYDIAGPDADLCFCPMKDLETPGDITWATEWVESLCRLAGLEVGPRERNSITEAILLLRESPERTLTELVATIQDDRIGTALKHYTLEGAMKGLLEANRNDDALGRSRFMCFEMEHVMNLGDEKATVSLLLYLFRQIEKMLDGSPSLIILDEAWLYLANKLFSDEMRKWLKTFRKRNGVLLIATQSLSDVMKSAIRDEMLESCPTKILLPNPEAGNENSRELYRQMGLNPREIGIVQTATPKQQYYVTSPAGRRLISLGLGPVSLAFVGISDKDTRNEIQSLITRHPENWQEMWLRRRRLEKWADFFRHTVLSKYQTKEVEEIGV